MTTNRIIRIAALLVIDPIVFILSPVTFPTAPDVTATPDAAVAQQVAQVKDLTKGHDCDIANTLPSGAIIHYRGKDPIYTTKHRKVDAAFDFAIAKMTHTTPKDPNIVGVTLCLD